MDRTRIHIRGAYGVELLDGMLHIQRPRYPGITAKVVAHGQMPQLYSTSEMVRASCLFPLQMEQCLRIASGHGGNISGAEPSLGIEA